jgi:uncharacterized protein
MGFKILSLDGGGTWALIQARVLQDIYGDITGHALLRQFDLVISNSGGSLVLAALCNNMKLSEITALFLREENRRKIFSPLTFWEKLQKRNIISFLRKWLDIGPKYNTRRKLTGILEVLTQYDTLYKTGQLSQSLVNTPLHLLPGLIGKPELQLIIVGFDYFRERVSFFRSNPGSNTDNFSQNRYYQITLAHALHASTNAPVNFFDAPAEVTIEHPPTQDQRQTLYWDGAVAGFNNPVLAGLIEALTNNPDRPYTDYAILSLGTGIVRKAIIANYRTSTNERLKEIYRLNQDKYFALSDYSSRFLNDLSKMAQSILSDPPDSATFIAYAILDPALTGQAHLVRINPCLTPELNPQTLHFELPPVYSHDPNGDEKFKQLLDLEMDATEETEVNLINDLCDKFIPSSGPALPNQLIRGDAASTYLGQKSYQQAKAKWLSLQSLA